MGETHDSFNDLAGLYSASAEVRRWSAERENASARLELARTSEARSYLLSQYEPVASTGVDRNVLRVLLAFTAHHDKARLARELKDITS
jgi:hypothetical protein